MPSIDKWFPFHINITTILFKTFGTLCVSGEENVIQVDPPPPWTVLDVTSQTLFTYFAYAKNLNFVRGGGGRDLIKAVFMSVYRRLAIKTVNSIEKHVKKGRCPKTFWPGLYWL